mgnify:CR=1 FL=1
MIDCLHLGVYSGCSFYISYHMYFGIIHQLLTEKVSIFNLDTFQGIAYWFDRSNADSNLTFIDTYDNEYSGCSFYISYHMYFGIIHQLLTVYYIIKDISIRK